MDTYSQPAYTQPPTELSVWDLFGCQMGVEDVAGVPVLRQNSPNPFNPRTEIAFGLRAPSLCRLSIYDVSGRCVTTLLDELRGPGTHRVEWDGRTDEGVEVGTGVYLYRLETNRGTSERKMLLLK